MRPRLGVVGFVLAMVALAGCMTARPPRVSGSRFAPLLARDLPRFEQRVVLDERARPHDPWVAVARAWADLVSCRSVREAAASDLTSRPPRGVVASDPSAELAYATVALEQARFDRMRRQGDGDVQATWLARLLDETFFRREPEPPLEAGGVRWLPEREAWIDELPVRREVPSRCDARLRALASEDPAALVERERAAASRVIELARGCVDAHRVAGGPSASLCAILAWRAERHLVLLGALPIEGADAEDAAAPRAARDHEATREALRALLSRAPRNLSHRELVETRLHLARLERDAGEPGAALDTLLPALALRPGPALRVRARYHALVLARETGRRPLARSLAMELPARAHPLHDAIAFEMVRLHAEDDDVPALIRTATGALRDRSIGDDRFRNATLTLVLTELARTELDARVIEVIEDLGPRDELFARMELLTLLALDQDEAGVADGAARWLHAHTHDARRRRVYLVWVALSALLRDDVETFEATTSRIVERPAELSRAVGARRASAFFRERDRGLLLLLDEALPRIAEWGDGARDHARAQRWLARLVERVQGFLRQAPHSHEREPLLALYRAASAMLESLPRGYSEQVARDVPRPLVLGRAAVPWPEPEAMAIEVSVSPVEGFGVLPADERWVFAWPETFGRSEDAR